jgi:competence protein ComEC
MSGWDGGDDGADAAGGSEGGSGVNEVTTRSGYGPGGPDVGHLPAAPGHPVSDGAVVVLAAVTVTAVVSGRLLPAVMVVAVAVSGSRSARRAAPTWIVVALLLAGGGALRSTEAWASLEPVRLGHYEGWARLVDDPSPFPSSTRVLLEIEGERFETWARGRAQRYRVTTWQGGDWVLLHGQRLELGAERARRVAWQHVVGEFRLVWASDVVPGGPLARASNRVRSTVERAAEAVPEPYGALYRGLVIGDDRDQPREMVERFRASGLSHLTAVSGQNVVFVLAVFGPLLVRLRPWPRLVLTLGVIFWFVTLTRFEPSILRAGMMAGLSALAYTTGRERSPVRLLAVSVILLVLVDPLLAWSVGFWLSVGATAGVCVVGPWLAVRFGRLGALALPLAVTLGAQIGVALPSVLVFGRLPLSSVVANLLAVPVASFVMLYGLPAGLIAGSVSPIAPVVMFPAHVGARWVDTVAHLGARLEPEPPWTWLGWALVALAVLALLTRPHPR